MAFTTLDQFATVEAVLLAGSASFDRLTVDAASRRGRVVPCRYAHLLAQGGQNLDPDAVALPRLEVVVHGSPTWEIPRQHPPGATGPIEVEDSIDHLAHVGLARPTLLGYRWEVRRQKGPLLIREIARVWWGSHPPILAKAPSGIRP